MAGSRAGIERVRRTVRAHLIGPQLLAFVPALTLGSYWLGGEVALVATAVGLPVLLLALTSLATRAFGRDGAADPVTRLPMRPDLVAEADRLIAGNPAKASTMSVLTVAVDEFDRLTERQGQDAGAAILCTCAERLRSAVRDTDLICRLEGPRFAVLLTTGSRADLESLIQLSSRIQRQMQDPVSLDGSRVFFSTSVGFCPPRRADAETGEALLAAAEQALDDAASTGAGAIRAYSREMQRRPRVRGALADELPRALEDRQIRPWFQPQIRMDTGEITGLEALARWDHPKSGLIPPAEFLPAAQDLGLTERLGEVMLYESLNALRAWDANGCSVPAVSLNFSGEELRDPTIVEKIRWELDRFDMAPDRLTVEVLETVIAQTSNDTVVRNLRGFAELGCRIDLDDFGTGHASIAGIRRFSVGRIKIDRSFVTQIDTDAEQQNIVGAILTLAEKLNIDTLAEGVENAAEEAVLRRLGCGYAQGYGIARPMPFDAVEDWVTAYRSRCPGGAAATQDAAPHAPPEQGKTA